MNRIKNTVMKRFEMVDLKEIKLFLGIKVSSSENTLHFDQTTYIETILNKYDMQDSKPVSTPLEVKLDWGKTWSVKERHHTQFVRHSGVSCI